MTPTVKPVRPIAVPKRMIKKILKHFETHRSLFSMYLYDQRLSPAACANTTIRAIWIYSAPGKKRWGDMDSYEQEFNKIVDRGANRIIAAAMK